MERLIIVSADGHLGAQPETYREYLEPAFRASLADLERDNRWFLDAQKSLRPTLPADMLEAVDSQYALRSGGEQGGFDIGRRMRELDREGVTAEIVFPGHQVAIQPFFSVINNPFPPELRAAGARAYHRWASDCFAESQGRMFGVADPGPCLDMDATLRELRWCAEHGFRSVQLPGNTADRALPPLTDQYFEPFWSSCEELGLVLAAHAGYGHEQGRFTEFARGFLDRVVKAGKSDDGGSMMQAFESAEDSPLQLDMGPRRVVWQLMLGGVFDRHPKLRLGLTEVRADWLPPTLRHLDLLAAKQKTPLSMKPSEYWSEHCFITPSSIHICEMEMRREIGVDRLLFGTDYPHPEGTWPNTQDWIRATFKRVPEREARAILGENAIRCYGLDRDRLTAIAGRIGPRSEDVLGEDHVVDPICVRHFHQRGGLLHGPERVDTASIEALFSEDLSRVGANPTSTCSPS